MDERGSSARGFSLAEALVALLLGALIVQVALGFIVRQAEVQRSLAHRAEELASVRVTRTLLGAEVRWGDGLEAGWEISTDSVRLRAYRGLAWICPEHPASDEVVAVVRGVRAPDPEKDSLWIYAEDGSVHVLALRSRTPSGVDACAGTAPMPTERWRLSGDVPKGALLARFFERGSYHLQAASLRYRRGMAGRQPLTPAVLRTPPSGFSARPEALGVLLIGDRAAGLIGGPLDADYPLKRGWPGG